MSTVQSRGVGYMGYIVIGITSTLIGPSLPYVIEEFGLSYSVAGTLLFVHWTGYFVAVVLGGIASDFLGKKPFLLAGAGCLMLGLTGFALGRIEVVIFAAMILIGAGFGALDGGLNGLIIDISGESKGLGLGLLHMFFGVGALSGPFLSTVASGTTLGWRWAFFWTAGLALLFIVLLLPCHLRNVAADERIEIADLALLGKNRLMFLFILLLFAYVGAEQGITGWLPTYMSRARGAVQSQAAYSLSLFWIGLTAGRLIVGLVSDKIGYARTVVGLSTGSVLFIFLALIVPQVSVAMGLFGMAGLFFSGTVPTVMAQAGTVFQRYSGTVSGVLTGACGLGGMVIPLGMGILSDWLGLTAGLVASLGALVVVLGLALYNLQYSR